MRCAIAFRQYGWERVAEAGQREGAVGFVDVWNQGERTVGSGLGRCATGGGAAAGHWRRKWPPHPTAPLGPWGASGEGEGEGGVWSEMEDSLIGGGASTSFQVEDGESDGLDTGGGHAAYGSPSWGDGTDGDQEIDPLIRATFHACDLDGDGQIAVDELRVALAAMGYPDEPRLAQIVRTVEHQLRDEDVKRSTSRMPVFRRDFHFDIKKKVRTGTLDEESPRCCKKSRATVGAPFVKAKNGVHHALYRAINAAAHSAKRIGIHAEDEALEFDGVRCLFGRGVQATHWVPVELNINDETGMLTIDLNNGTKSEVSLRDCKVNKPRLHRRGYPYCLRLDTATPHRTIPNSAHLEGCNKFLLATSSEDSTLKWAHRMQPFTLHADQRVDGALDMHEFQRLIQHEFTKVFPEHNWRTGCRKIVKLHRAFQTADLDGDHSIQQDELELVIRATGSLADTADKSELWELLVADSKVNDEVGWFDFLQAVCRLHDEPQLQQLLNVDKPNRWALISLLIDVPVSKATEAELLEDMTAVERTSIQFLQKMQKKTDKVETTERLIRAEQGLFRKKTPEQKKRIRHIRWWLQWWLFWIATITNAVAGIWENYLMWQCGTDSTGLDNGFYLTCNTCKDEETFGLNLLDCAVPYVKDSCDITGTKPTKSYTDMVIGGLETLITLNTSGVDAQAVNEHQYGGYNCLCDSGMVVSGNTAVFWGLNLPMIVVTVLLEIYLMGFAALRASCLVAAEYEFRLTPLNETRAFVARAFIRATFELGQPKSAVLGVDPEQKSTFQLKLEAAVMGMLYILKVLLLGTAIKLLLWQPFMPMIYYTWVGSYSPLVASIFWDALIGSVIMDQVENRAHGVIAGTELFNDLVEKFSLGEEDEPQSGGFSAERPKLSELGRIQVVRAIGVAIVENGVMYPSMELLLRHAIQYFDIPTLVPEGIDAAELDSSEMLMEKLPDLPRREQMLVAAVHLLAILLDGTLTLAEIRQFRQRFYSQPTNDQRELEFDEREPNFFGSWPRDENNSVRGGQPNVIGNERDLAPRMLHLSYLFRTRQYLTAEDLVHAIAGHAEFSQLEIEYPFWRNCCGRGVDLTTCKIVYEHRELKAWPVGRYMEEFWNLMTFKLV